ncbi:sensor histidine kinase KdpD [uncultured Acetatifactor sp.]|uniref:sensor histidine kinase n=1 Tax=uncultured Acetatifactor sp. TaxID=1671927 RepID=UPI002625CAE8|nr:HAMP domain-containing sensor histidine kinase [uncultured Acetatifactor sp.]
MSTRKNVLVTLGLTVSASLLAAALAVLFFTFHYGRLQFDLLNAVCGEVVEQDPEARRIVAAALKEYTGGNADGTAVEDILWSLGYRVSDFSVPTYRQSLWCIGAGFLAGSLLFACTWAYRNRREALRVQALTAYLEQACTGAAPILSASVEASSREASSGEPATGEDDFSRLEDEIYKTVTSLYQAKEAALRARNGFAENLSNIAHQIRTPITAISLSLQILEYDRAQKASGAQAHLEQIQKQLQRLTHLEEALLLLSRIDAGALALQREEVDVFTLLTLAAENLQELLAASAVSLDIPEQGGMRILADLDWTMEAVMNLMKNCMEHGGGGTIHCSYAQNPLYTEILIWDQGQGFAKEDIPHLFERFYRGQNAARGGIGIGLALAKEIIQRQNGTLRARNRPAGGALFEIRFYSH